MVYESVYLMDQQWVFLKVKTKVVQRVVEMVDLMV